MPDIDLRNKIGCLPVERSGEVSDNIGIAFCTYFNDHMDRPDNDPETDCGWGEWVEQKANEALDIIAEFIEAERSA